ncbi:MAG TPA: prepilin-type N-terminal cleavage/methylation domain-containing protein [Candidatus Acidoferrales bacterium]|nr:prepilin-type N-terminal cleavage/methylation domain-containing protein [Candidatus Acidoferrales bacterium]
MTALFAKLDRYDLRKLGQIRGLSKGDSGARGFTLLELMIVAAIIMIFATIAVGRYEQSVIRAREATLRSDLATMRKAIQDYTEDKEAGPQSLDDLVSGGYLRAVPVDPLTGAKDWTTDTDELLVSPEQTTTGITDVHSGSGAVSPFDGTAYSSW